LTPPEAAIVTRLLPKRPEVVREVQRSIEDPVLEEDLAAARELTS